MLYEKPSQCLYGARSQAFALNSQPVFEGRLVDCETFEQITVIEAYRFLQRNSRSLADELVKACHIDDDPGRLETDQIALSTDRLDLAFRQGVAEIEQALP